MVPAQCSAVSDWVEHVAVTGAARMMHCAACGCLAALARRARRRSLLHVAGLRQDSLAQVVADDHSGNDEDGRGGLGSTSATPALDHRFQDSVLFVEILAFQFAAATLKVHLVDQGLASDGTLSSFAGGTDVAERRSGCSSAVLLAPSGNGDG